MGAFGEALIAPIIFDYNDKYVSISNSSFTMRNKNAASGSLVEEGWEGHFSTRGGEESQALLEWALPEMSSHLPYKDKAPIMTSLNM